MKKVNTISQMKTLTIGAILFFASASSVNAQCNGLSFDIDGDCISDNNGWVAVSNISGGISPWSIMWSSGDVSAYVSDLANGPYTATVTDATGCSVSQTVIIDCDFTINCQLRTQTQGGWGSPPNGNNPGMYLHTNFASCFPNGVMIGCNNTLKLTTAQAVTDYLPGGGKSAMLPNGMMMNPTNYKNTLAAQLVAATISVGFDACDPNFGQSALLLGDAIINTGTFSGWSVQQLIDEANSYIGGCGSSYSKSDLNSALDMVNNNFVDGNTNNGNIDCKKDDPKSMNANAVSELVVYPNPSDQNVTLDFSFSESGFVEVLLVDITGRTMRNQQLSVEANIGQRLMFDVSDLNAGVYLAVIRANGSVKTEQLIIAH